MSPCVQTPNTGVDRNDSATLGFGPGHCHHKAVLDITEIWQIQADICCKEWTEAERHKVGDSPHAKHSLLIILATLNSHKHSTDISFVFEAKRLQVKTIHICNPSTEK